jgi:hypothetical protein
MDDHPSLTYQTKVPFSWQPIDSVTPLAIEESRYANLAMLRALSTLDATPEKDHDADPAVAKAIDRLEAKLDIAVTLLSRLVAQQTEIPAVASLAFGVRQASWSSVVPMPAVGSNVLLKLHLSPILPQALQLYACVVKSDADSCVAEYLDQDEELEEWITRTIFRYHRRTLQARHQPR